MPKVINKEKLCSCQLKYFKSIQGWDEHRLFDIFTHIEEVVIKNIDQKYRHFLAQPVIEYDTITWFSKPYNETPKRLSELRGEDYIKYNVIKKNTIGNYHKTIKILENKGQNNEAQALENCIKFIHNDFLYCYDDIVVLGIWGMQLRENIRESIGTISKNLFKEKLKPPFDESPKPEIETPEPTCKDSMIIRFNAGDNGKILGNVELPKYSGDIISESEVPQVEPKAGYEFTCWNKNPNGYKVTGETTFNAQYSQKVTPISKLPWYQRFWNWLKELIIGRGCFKWLLWFILFLVFILLLIWLLRGCNEDKVHPIPSPIVDKPWIKDDSRVGDGGGIYDPGNPYQKLPTPPNYRDVLPPNQGDMPPIDTTNIITEPGKPAIISNRLNVLMENEDKSILDLAKEFKVKYPDNKYKVVYYDDVVKRMQIEVPPAERLKLKSEIPDNFAPNYKLFVFDESLFGIGYTPNDPAFASADKSWYLKSIQAPKAWDFTKGSPNLTIAIVDNGFSLNHPELQSKVVMPYNVWLHSKEIFPQNVDHGTHVAGIALALIDNKKGLCGIAPNCAFMPVQVANKQGVMTTTSILDGILYALYQGADVINVSLGMEFKGNFSESEQRQLQNNYFKEEERLWNKIMEISDKHKTIIVVAAGNENMLAGISPISRPKSFIVVSAVDKSNQEYHKAGFSNYGDYSTVSAPGVSIYSTVGNNDYQFMQGTSMAAPIITGTIALMKSLNANLTTEQIVCILQRTGIPTQGKVGNLVQIDQALQKLQSGEFKNCDNQPDTASKGDIINTPPPPHRRKDDLLREREKLQKQLDEIDRELKEIRNNVNFKNKF
ncbi:MAG: S8 family serine peptidase [Limnohabitans sp.]|nr:S8 family serine peptidase [Limnohabitans sp.]